MTAVIKQWLLHHATCRDCGHVMCAELPAGVPRHSVGPRLQALMGIAAGQYRMSKRLVQQMLSDFFGVRVSLGSIPKLEQATSAALATPVAAACAYVQAQRVVHADETGWRQAARRAWLWVAVACGVAVFVIRRGRGAAVAKELLGASFSGCLVSDRWNAYNWVRANHRQLCWAHLMRQFKGFTDYDESSARIGNLLTVQCRLMFHHWHRVRDGTLSRTQFINLMRPIRGEILRLLDFGQYSIAPQVAGRCAEILKLKTALFTFVRVPGVEPTNNLAERVLRPAVIWRKLCFGTDSECGSRFVERMLTTVATLRLQHRNVLEYVTSACEAALHGQLAPSLLPPCSEGSLSLAA